MTKTKLSSLFFFTIFLLLLSCSDSSTDSEANNAPNTPTNPSPLDGAVGVEIEDTLSWICSDADGDSLFYDIYFATENPPMDLLKKNHPANKIALSDLDGLTDYYWKVVAKDGKGDSTESPIWKFTTNDPGMIFVEGGLFMMGNENGDEDESPVHEVTLNSFYISKYEVTNAEFCEFLNEMGNQEEAGKPWLKTNHGLCKIKPVGDKFEVKEGYENHPVVFMTWYGAWAYCRWKGGRLPTEAEWEYAARGGNKSKGYLYAGSDNMNDVGWYADNSGQELMPVGQKMPNELGLYDMSGNVWEWCIDWYAEDYYSNSVGSTNPDGPEEGEEKVLRGGSYWFTAEVCDVNNRFAVSPLSGHFIRGLRLVKDIEK